MDKVNPSVLFAENTSKTTYDDFDEGDIKRAKQRLADSIGLFCLGPNAVGIPNVVDVLTRWGGCPESSIYNYGIKVPAHQAAFINSMQLRSYDFEPVDPAGLEGRWPGHVTSSTLPTALALAEKLHLSGREFLTALLVGDDMASRLIEACRFSTLMCFDGNGTSNCLGATATAAKALGLTASQTLDAFGIALNMAGGTMHNTHGFWTFKLPNALSSFHAIWAAEMALSGYQGLSDPLTGEQCFFDMFAISPDTSYLTEKLGEIYYSDMVIKPWSSCRSTHVVLDAARKVLIKRDQKTFSPDEIRRIKVGAPASVTGFVGRDFPFGSTVETDGLFSIRYTLSAYLLRGAVYPESYQAQAMCDPAIKALQDKIELYLWDPLNGKEGSGGMAARVEVELIDDTVIEGEVQGVVLGDCELSPLSDDELFRKFSANVKASGKSNPDDCFKAWDLAQDVENLEDMCGIIELFA